METLESYIHIFNFHFEPSGNLCQVWGKLWASDKFPGHCLLLFLLDKKHIFKKYYIDN